MVLTWLVNKLNNLFPEISNIDRINLFKNAIAKMMLRGRP